MVNKIEEFLNEKFGNVRAVKDEKGIIWFVAVDVAKVLGYRLATDMTRIIDNNYKDKKTINTVGGNQKMITINKKGLHNALTSNRRLNKEEKSEFYTWLTGEEYYSVINKESKESKFIYKLEESLKPLGITGVKQFKVLGRYRLDFYIPSLDLAVEFDENNHKGYTLESHESRQREIEDELDIKFVRVSDENSDCYNIGVIMNKILNIISLSYAKEIVDFGMKYEYLENLESNGIN